MVSVTLTYRQPGTQPPIFVAGSFSDPQWQPLEMDFTTEEGGEHTFYKNVEVPPSSQIQYKFRVGLGDWWALNEDAAKVTDDSGNQNNVLTAPASQESTNLNGVKPQEEQDATSTANMDTSTAAAAHSASQLEPKPRTIQHLKDEERQRLSSTPIEQVADTAAEVADTAKKLDAEDNESRLAPLNRLKDDERKRLSSTPIEQVANTAAEVADTAKKLDAEDDSSRLAPLNRLKDDERKRLSSTPIEQVATTAAEVADTAKMLDVDQDFDDKDLVDEGPPPLFTHEALGPYEPPSDDDDEAKETEDHGTVVYDVDKYDLNDPTLERLPSNRDGIMNAVRKVETGRNEDHTHFHGTPMSPIVGSRRTSLDPYEEAVISPGPSSPGLGKKLELPRKSHGSMVSERSLASLGSIVEEEGRESPGADEASRENGGPIRVPSPAIRPTPNVFTSPASDEDEGVVMKGSKSKFKKSSESPRSDSPDLNGNTNGKHSRDLSPKSRPAQPDSPSILVQPPEDTAESSIPAASSTARDDGHKGQLKKRGGASSADRPGTPSSIHSVADSKGNWLSAFFRVLFVDWIGGLFSRLFGSKRKVMLATSTAAIVLGAAWWKFASDGDLSWLEAWQRWVL
ncbi:hypothetical protein CkaCkLH20_08456 [Colletotrichum karsti]|uniref:AMP-activated protein kinase glycogen-binding domain-containing protein n=1 Tax=Colletotrichum karsti TaxID=1095194 RepID=A0A9P6I0L8_9PEZI|nr:uncharacterized protein CkaCkLH20_08456 [Colletotrichum karsti]KAF9874084.1 hypothetical protein CkaCkLH20_08456 [Colletotrichum karsti]